MKRFLIMAAIMMSAVSCTVKNGSSNDTLPPVSKPTITLSSDRLTPEALWAMGRIGSVKADVETGLVAYTVSYYSVEQNRSTTWVRVCNPYEGEDYRLDATRVKEEFVGNEPAWFGQSGWLAYLKGGKLYLHRDDDDIVVEGTEDVEGFLLSPDRNKVILIKQIKTVASTADKYPDLPLASGRVVDEMMYKHWDEWTETAPQPIVCDLEITYYGKGERIRSARINNEMNLLEGTAYESPMKPFGGVEQLAWSPDNRAIAYTCRKKTGLDYALSTNSDIYLYDLPTGTTRNVTEGMMGYDTNPMFSPDGQFITWQSMERDGYESDQNRLFIMRLETGEKQFLSKAFESNVDEYQWLDNEHIVFSGVWHGLKHLYLLDLHGKIEQLTDGQYDYTLADVSEGRKVFTLRHSMCDANEIGMVVVDLDYKHHRFTMLTEENKNIYDQVTMGTVEPRWQKTTDGKQMLTWIIYPPHFDPNKKYPTLLYCEGGPQSPVSQFWSFRWNFMMMAANDYIIVAPNRRGLPGFGNEWNEAISGDYGGQCMTDLLTAIDEACANLPYVDKERLGCVGASFGGYSVYWMAGHHNRRFKAFIAHDGIFNLEMQYLETEELWFTNWDLGGPYWDKNNKIAQKTYANSPHLFVDKWDTPILCIHGEKDYRILANQAMAAYDAAKIRGIDAQLLIFPDENHWVLKPQNGILWQRTFFNWLDKYLK